MQTDQTLLLVKFSSKSIKQITNLSELGSVIRVYNQYGIEYIKVFNSSTERFQKLSKVTLTAQLSWYTDSYLELQKTGYIK